MKQPKISVLISVYKEKKNEIEESLSSIINQTFSDFEVILVVDNPERKDVEDIVNSFHDKRITVYHNLHNMGLALSMNYAASLATGSVFARMDADDVSEPQRFAKEYEQIVKGYDFVFTKYRCIDGQSKVLKDGPVTNLNSDLATLIEYNPNIIHHPTVMFTKDCFYKAGCYRNFPCSQDADLWLRMQEIGVKFYYIDEPLLRYRINPEGISSSNWFKQQLTIYYIMKLSVERKEKKKDTFSEENYNHYLEKQGLHDEKKKLKLLRSEKLLERALQLKNDGHVFNALLLRVYVFFSNSFLRDYYLNKIRKYIIVK